MRTSKLAIIGIIGVAALWSAGWFAGKTLYVEPEADLAVEKLRDGDLFFSYEKRSVGGFPLAYDVAYEGVAVADASDTWRWTAPFMSVSSGVADSGALILRPSDESRLRLKAPPNPDGEEASAPLEFDMKSEDLELRLSNDVAEIELAAEATSVALTQIEGDATLISEASIRIDGLDFDAKMIEAGGDGEGVVTADQLDVSYRISPDGVTETYSSSSNSNIKIAFSGSSVDVESLSEFLAVNGSAYFEFSTGEYDAVGETSGGPSAPPVKMLIEGASTKGVVEIADGRARYEASGQDIDYSMETNAPGAPVAGEATLEEVSMSFEMPLKKADDPQPYNVSIKFLGLEFDDGVWGLIDPAKALERTEMNINVDLTGDARILVDLGSEYMNETPVDVETLKIEAFELDGLGASAMATGDLNIAGDASRPDGAIKLELNGGFALIDQFVAAGVIPEGAAEFYKGLALAYARPGEGPDQLITEIKASNGAITVNGQPIQ